MMLKAADVARELNISRTAAYQLMHELGPVRFGERGIRLPAERLKRFVESQRRRVEPTSVLAAVEAPAPKVEASRARTSLGVSAETRSRLTKAIEKARRPGEPQR